MMLRPLLSSQLCKASAALSMFLLAGCAVGPDFAKPDDRLSDVRLSPRTDDAAVHELSAVNVPMKWWTLFNDPLLTDLQDRAQFGNLSLQMASERIEQSRAQLGIASSQLLPSIGGSASYSRDALSEHGRFAALGAPTNANDFWQLGFDARWEIDLWGHARRAREGAAAAFEATVYDREAIRIALSAEVGRVYLQLRGTQAQLDTTRQNQLVAERALELTESRERNGVTTRFEVSSARAQLATIKAMTPECQWVSLLNWHTGDRTFNGPKRSFMRQQRLLVSLRQTFIPESV